jgi:selenocysteine-specific elongation factor
MVQGVRDLFAEHGEITAAALRDRFNTSRKYAIGLLEHLDTLKITRRIGDKRVLR